MSNLEVGGIVLGGAIIFIVVLYKLTESTNYLADARTLEEQKIANKIRKPEPEPENESGGTRRKRRVFRSRKNKRV